MEVIKRILTERKESYLQSIEAIMPKLDEIQKNPLLILTELYDVVKLNKVDTYFVFSTELQNNVYIPLLQTLDIFKGFTLKSTSCFNFSVYDTKQEFYICTFDISAKCYFGTIKEPVNYNDIYNNETLISKEILDCADEYVNQPSLINKYKFARSDPKNKSLFTVIKLFFINKTTLVNACKEGIRREKHKKQLFETQDKEYKTAMEMYTKNKEQANQLYEQLNKIGYHKV